MCLCMFELHEGAGGTGCTNTGLESAASLAVQSAGFQPVVKLQPANLFLHGPRPTQSQNVLQDNNVFSV